MFVDLHINEFARFSPIREIATWSVIVTISNGLWIGTNLVPAFERVVVIEAIRASDAAKSTTTRSFVEVLVHDAVAYHTRSFLEELFFRLQIIFFRIFVFR